MSVMLDGEDVFGAGEVEFEVGLMRREFIERRVCGFGGIVSIDVGMASREIRQRGRLWSRSREGIEDMVCEVREFMDGGSHLLVTGLGSVYEYLRLDYFEVGAVRSEGGGAAAEYEVVYTQVRV